MSPTRTPIPRHVALLLLVGFVFVSLALFVGTVRSLSSIQEERKSQRNALADSNVQMSEIRAASTRRIDALTAQLKSEQEALDQLHVNNAQLQQELRDHGITP